MRRVFLGEDLDFVAIDNHVVAFNFDVVVEDTVNRVVFQHISQIVGVQQVVDAYNLNVVAEILDSSTEYHTADAAETVNT